GPWTSAAAPSSELAAADAHLGPASIHGRGGVCRQAHSDIEMGTRTHRDAAGINLQSVGAQRRWCCARLRAIGHGPLFQRGPEKWAGLGARTVDDALRAQQTAANRVRAVGADGVPADGAAAA